MRKAPEINQTSPTPEEDPCIGFLRLEYKPDENDSDAWPGSDVLSVTPDKAAMLQAMANAVTTFNRSDDGVEGWSFIRWQTDQGVVTRVDCIVCTNWPLVMLHRAVSFVQNGMENEDTELHRAHHAEFLKFIGYDAA
jgi:hypothetical protein